MSGTTFVVSADGTPIACRIAGEGPPVVLVSGSLDDGTETGPLADVLSAEFTTAVYARRGRGESGDRPGSSVADEIADLRAVIDAVGGRAAVIGVSSGGALAVRAITAGAPISRLVLYEVPFDTSPGASERSAAYTARVEELVASGDLDGALTAAMTLWGSPPEVIDGVRNSPYWAPLRRVAHTLVYDAHVMGEGAVPVAELAAIDVPVLAVTSSGLGEEMAGLDGDFFGRAAEAVVAAVPDGRHVVLDVAGHELDAAAVAPHVAAFLREDGDRPDARR